MSSFRASVPPVLAMHVQYRDAQGRPLPLSLEEAPLAKESLEFEVRALRLINEAQRKRIRMLEVQLAQRAGHHLVNSP